MIIPMASHIDINVGYQGYSKQWQNCAQTLNLHCSLNQLLLWEFLTHMAKKSQVRPSLKARSHSRRVQVKSGLMI